MSVLHINKSNFDSEVLNSDKTVLVDFYADWCGPCRMVSPIVDEIAAEHPEIKVCKINVDENPEIATTRPIESSLFYPRSLVITPVVQRSVSPASINALIPL